MNSKLKNTNYSRENAVNYALKYANTPNSQYKYFPVNYDNGGDCTNFTSQCLFAGGAPMVFTGKNIWWCNSAGCSVSWSTAHSLYWYLKINTDNNLYGIKGKEATSTSDLEIGDLIFYRNKNNRITHSAIITSFMDNIPLISQHTPELLNIPYIKLWASKTYFMKIFL
ncbi:putative amidase domain-containing protein [Clostridium pasteurianum DSM 525 = ATCC 6013]|jgi:hypothetical protein|uniref:Putative amidase domain-containing protein n=1 Tax=Clostridium pasteurianum DSM 525 = ATCC 6013 TaxID=1262449 RepID=A0A0H3J954_CLOPA|nr:amidase domain-containing protein [Clostridium pasteurianum]AJA47630.1 putative amidase domain-containing protein [Clostridium pasteurianum DSM 525 = ATCC 6013]AJA51618.1 putative amidase domain-containing protein [Clostridium pasteurianum DSM 525 = ATCC 6013]AOZ74940.1 methylase [Clostridium pasteurianum DSM 525 = ATCC 6013]AOZ78735.1 methylase [Clostridium pasteurianum]ELP58030.1 hypothetical protein F502_16325 [Clostridium pasteurianum DSM 525 = ATCC 6013]